MCVLLIAWKLSEAMPLVVAANRDEARQRASLPPSVQRLGERRVLLPRDQVAGGTWLGVNDAGVAVAITNRADGSFDSQRASRGQLPLAALAMRSATEVLSMLKVRTAETLFNSFNLFCADREHAWVARWDGSLQVTKLSPGAFVLTNSHNLDELQVPEFHALPWRAADAPKLRDAMQALLGDHAGRDATGYPLCKHGARYGTVSSSVFFPTGKSTWEMAFSSGNPCTTPFLKYYLDGEATTLGG